MHRMVYGPFFLNEQARDSADFIDRGEVTDGGEQIAGYNNQKLFSRKDQR
jgi:hypothetical protein